MTKGTVVSHKMTSDMVAVVGYNMPCIRMVVVDCTVSWLTGI